MDSSVPSATVTRDKPGCVQDLYLQTVETRGTRVLPPRDCIRYAFALQPSTSFHPEGLICGVIDIVAFLIILITARRSRVARYPGMPTILDTILRDATHYFVLMFIVQLVSVLFDLFAPVGGI